MSTYVSSKDALERDLASAEAALQGATAAYAVAKRMRDEAYRASDRAYDGMATNQANVDRIRAALDALNGGAS